MKKLLILALLIVSIVSCRSQRPTLTKQATTTVKDSVFKTIQAIDTLQVLRPSDTAKIHLPYEKLSTAPILLKNQHATVSLKKTGNVIEAECYCDELKEAVKIYKETITQLRETITEQNQTIVEVRNQMNFLQKLFFWIGVIVITAIVLILIFKVLIPKR